MSSVVETIRGAKADDTPELLASMVPFARWMGISLRHQDGELLGVLAYSGRIIGNPALPAVHGGALGALLESTAIFQLLWDAETVVLPKTIDLTIDYMRSARPIDTFARGIVTRQGRRVANVRAEAWQEDRERPVAIAHGHFLITPMDDDR